MVEGNPPRSSTHRSNPPWVDARLARLGRSQRRFTTRRSPTRQSPMRRSPPVDLPRVSPPRAGPPRVSPPKSTPHPSTHRTSTPRSKKVSFEASLEISTPPSREPRYCENKILAALPPPIASYLRKNEVNCCFSWRCCWCRCWTSRWTSRWTRLCPRSCPCSWTRS